MRTYQYLEFDGFRSKFTSKLRQLENDFSQNSNSIKKFRKELKTGAGSGNGLNSPNVCNSTSHMRYKEVCISVHLNQHFTQADAARKCIDTYGKQANLVTLNDQKKEEAVFDFAHATLVADLNSRTDDQRRSRRKNQKEVFFWMGLEQKRRSWWYPNGRKVDIQTDYFSLGAPSHPCVTIGPFDPRKQQSKQKMWITKSCREMNKFICEYPIMTRIKQVN